MQVMVLKRIMQIKTLNKILALIRYILSTVAFTKTGMHESWIWHWIKLENIEGARLPPPSQMADNMQMFTKNNIANNGFLNNWYNLSQHRVTSDEYNYIITINKSSHIQEFRKFKEIRQTRIDLIV